MTVVSCRLNEDELFYVNLLAKKMKVKTSRALKVLVSFAMNNNLDCSNPQNKVSDEVRKMLEQIHMMMPHLLYNSRIASKASLSSFTDEDFGNFHIELLDEMNRKCGDYQSVSYTQNYITHNPIGFSQMPIEQELSRWKLP